MLWHCVITRRRRPSPVPRSTFPPFRAPYAGGLVDAASPGASRRPWPSPVLARLGSPLLPLRGLPYRRGRLRFMLRTGESLALHRGLCHGASPVGSRLAAAVNYRAAWSLPGPDSHRLVDAGLSEITRLPHPPPSSGVRCLGTLEVKSKRVFAVDSSPLCSSGACSRPSGDGAGSWISRCASCKVVPNLDRHSAGPP